MHEVFILEHGVTSPLLSRSDGKNPRLAPAGRGRGDGEGRLCGGAPAVELPESLLEPLAGSLLFARMGKPRAEATTVGYSIRMPLSPRQTHCPHCRRSFRVAGPTGYEESGPICDVCLFERAEDLGLLLALASAVRAFASYRTDDGEIYSQALDELGSVARLYERLAARCGPPRPFRIAARMGRPTVEADDG